MNNDDKITFDELIESGKVLPNEKSSEDKIFKDEPKKKDFTILILCLIAVLFIVGCVYYSANAYSKISGTIKVSGTSAQSQLNAELKELKDGKVNINTAGIKVLCTLDGIGETRALTIISYREVNGPFKKIEDIKNVKDIGEDTFKKIENDICV